MDILAHSMKNYLLVLFVFCFFNVKAQYVVSKNCSNAHVLLMQFEFRKMDSILNLELKQNPENYYAIYLKQTAAAYKLLLNSDEKAYDKFLDNHYSNRELMDDKFVNSPYCLSCKAEMELQAGIFNIIHGDRFSGLRKAYSAYKNTYKNLEKFPDFKPSLKLDGFFNVAVDNLPPFVKWAVSAFGVSGNTDYGYNLLLDNYNTLKSKKGLADEAALFVILAAKLNKTPEKVYDFTKNLPSDIAQTWLMKYFKANIAYRNGHNSEALEIIETIDVSNPQKDLLYNYLKGKVLLLDLNLEAEKYLIAYLNSANKKGYLKEINYQMALLEFLKGDIQKFEYYRNKVLTDGNDINERDREALYDAKLDYLPDYHLLRAGLLLKGGYYEKYSEEIKSVEYNNLNNALKCEYHLFEGIYFTHNKFDEKALSEFEKVIAIQQDDDYYFSADAVCRMGMIYEKQNQTQKAVNSYNQTLKLYDSDFYEYIEDRAKKGLRRLGE